MANLIYHRRLVYSGMSKKYAKNFLKNVIFRLDFAQSLSTSKKSVNDFYEVIRNKFPKKEDVATTIFEALVVSGKDSSIKQSQKNIVNYKFSDETGEIVLMLESEPSNINLLITSYKNSDELTTLINLIISAIVKVYGDIVIKRTGLRYLNHIVLSEGNALDWTSLIDSRLISLLEFPADKRTISRGLGRIELSKDSHKVLFQFGMHNPEYPNPIARKEFILDYDCYVMDEISAAEIPKLVKVLHEDAKDLFERSILDGLREKMGLINDA